MSSEAIVWPKKTREIRQVVADSTRWNGFRLRDDDIIIDTWSKAGTTLTQQLVSQLITGGRPGLFAGHYADSPWLDMRLLPLGDVVAHLDAQERRRFIKTHLPVDALGIDPRAKYICCGRNARDVIWSMHHHHMGFTDGLIAAFNGLSGREGPPLETVTMDARDYYLYWLEHDALPGFPFPSFWDHVQGWWNIRHLPNVLLLHFNALKSDLPREARRVARFLDIAIDDATWPAIIDHCRLDYVRAEGNKDPSMKHVFKDGANTFFHKGTNGRWADVLSAEEIARCDAVAAKRLTPDCAQWLRTGETAPA